MEREAAALPGRKVGINWHGNPAAEQTLGPAGPLLPLSAVEPLARVRGVTIVSLQKGAGAKQREGVGIRGADLQLTDP